MDGALVLEEVLFSLEILEILDESSIELDGIEIIFKIFGFSSAEKPVKFFFVL